MRLTIPEMFELAKVWETNKPYVLEELRKMSSKQRSSFVSVMSSVYDATVALDVARRCIERNWEPRDNEYIRPRD